METEGARGTTHAIPTGKYRLRSVRVERERDGTHWFVSMSGPPGEPREFPAGATTKLEIDDRRPSDVARARAFWGDEVTSFYDGSSTSANVTGFVTGAGYDECPHAELTAMALEYGTVPLGQVFQALRADHWLHNHPEAQAMRPAVGKAMRDAFYVDADDWKEAVYAQARLAALATVERLGIHLLRFPMPGDGRGEFAALEQAAMAIADKGNRPVFFHCAAGKQRSNAAWAAYRLKFWGWSVEQALAELERDYDLDRGAEHGDRDECLVEPLHLPVAVQPLEVAPVAVEDRRHAGELHAKPGPQVEVDLAEQRVGVRAHDRTEPVLGDVVVVPQHLRLVPVQRFVQLVEGSLGVANEPGHELDP